MTTSTKFNHEKLQKMEQKNKEKEERRGEGASLIEEGEGQWG